MKEYTDEYGHPTHESLALIENWSSADIHGWFEFIGFIWAYPEWTWKEGEMNGKHYYHLFVSDIAANESIIVAMQRNIVLWTLTWYQSQRGGYFVFEVPDGF